MSFPLNSNDAYIKSTGERSTLGAEIGSGGGGGGGGSYTPDYEHDILIIGTHEDFEYYIPMSKRYVGDGITGYVIKTNPDSSMQSAKIDLYSIVYDKDAEEIVVQTLIKTLTHNGDNTYSDDFISITYTNDSQWSVAMLQTMYNTSGVTYTSPLQWVYSTQADYTLLTADPTSTT